MNCLGAAIGLSGSVGMDGLRSDVLHSVKILRLGRLQTVMLL